MARLLSYSLQFLVMPKGQNYYLLEYEADVNSRDSDGWTVVDM
jgi:hypothetical protein